MILSKILSSVHCNLEAKNENLRSKTQITHDFMYRNNNIDINIKFFSCHVLLFCLQVPTCVVDPLFHQSLLLLLVIVKSSKYTLYTQVSIQCIPGYTLNIHYKTCCGVFILSSVNTLSLVYPHDIKILNNEDKIRTNLR